MKCKICKATAVVALRSHNAAFCPDCYLKFFARQVEKGIEGQKLFTRDERILVALSGGKDSLALMLELSRQGYDVTGLHIDLGIPESSPVARGVVERFCAKHGLKLMVKELAAEGLAIPLVKERLNRPVCSACGKIKRHFFNKVALDEGFDALATGHNLDDEVARLFSNTLRWDTAYLSDQGPRLDGEDGFARKVKPLWRLTEFETANYAFLMGIEHHYAPCPYSPGASFSTLKALLQRLEAAMPGRKLDFYQGFLARARPVFARREAEEAAIPPRPATCAACAASVKPSRTASSLGCPRQIMAGRGGAPPCCRFLPRPDAAAALQGRKAAPKGLPARSRTDRLRTGDSPARWPGASFFPERTMVPDTACRRRARGTRRSRRGTRPVRFWAADGAAAGAMMAREARHGRR